MSYNIPMKKIRVAVLIGGKSPEHDVSLVSGKVVVNNLDKKKYQVVPVIISRDGRNWQIKTLTQFNQLNFKINREFKDLEKNSKKNTKFSIPINIKPSPDVFFIAMHGPFGEDGTIQGMLDFLGVTYTGAGVLASALAMNKILFRKIMEHSKILIPKGVSFSKHEQIPLNKIKKLGNSWVVKPSSQGSSVGITIVKDKKKMEKAIKNAFKYDDQILVEEYIKGIEVSCGVLGNEKPYALPVIEICPKNEFFDYEAKYTPGMCKEIVPARLSKQLTKKIQQLSVDVFKAINCSGFGRVDLLIKNNQPYVLEINTIPGLTPTSLLPQEAKAAGISYSQLLDLVIQYALE